MLSKHPLISESLPRAAITNAYRMDEEQCVARLIEQASLPTESLAKISDTARQLVTEIRKRRLERGGLDAFLYEYDLSSAEGIALMCLAEALLRIPDKETIDKLLSDKLTDANWASHLGQSESLFVNAATWGLLLTGKIYHQDEISEKPLRGALRRFVGRAGAPVIRQAAKQAMKLLGQQFVMGQTIEEALKRARIGEKKGYRYSYDMLGEAARTAKDAERYFQSYSNAIRKIGEEARGRGVIASPGISVKLSALYPRYEYAQRDIAVPAVTAKLLALAEQAKGVNIGLTIDAEEAERLDISLDIIEAVYSSDSLNGWEGFGLAVQSYQKRAPAVLDWLIDLARKYKRKIMVRLIKGAYWDSEIKVAQVKGLAGYPVFTRKAATDVSFIACAKKMLAARDALYCQFATHNAYSLAAVLEMSGGQHDFEFQCLHGMGYTLYDQVVGSQHLDIPCRVYAPVGGHEDLLAYLVRRLLENGANTSFVNRIIDDAIPIDEIIVDPVEKLRNLQQKAHPQIPLPINIYGTTRKNSLGIDLTNVSELMPLDKILDEYSQSASSWQAAPLINGVFATGTAQPVYDPSNKQQQIGTVIKATAEQVECALNSADKAFVEWEKQSVDYRASCLERAADLLEQRMPKFIALAVREAGKTIVDAVGEVREAVDFCRYYAEQARKELAHPINLPGPTGELNQLSLHGRGIIACISPWNFPLAIFMGQVTAALAAGNTVIAKPAEQTPIIATLTVQLLHEAGIPKEALHLLPGKGEVVGAKLVGDLRVKGVMFTGSTETARLINQTLANRSGPIIPFIAETGGQNTIIVDSSALLEQVVADVIASAFGSAGQRCSAARVLFVQAEIAPKLIEMLTGAMAELKVGDPGLLETDIGPVIDVDAKNILEAHAARMQKEAKLLYQINLSAPTQQGNFFAPCAFEINQLAQLEREVFGPVLHVIRFSANELDNVINTINNTGYGLTLGIQSRIDDTIEYIRQRVKVGNIYVNRNIIGAVVGVQPFGGEGLSGTGPKAGGPHYLPRLCLERALCINTTAAGGNASLMCLEE